MFSALIQGKTSRNGNICIFYFILSRASYVIICIDSKKDALNVGELILGTKYLSSSFLTKEKLIFRLIDNKIKNFVLTQTKRKVMKKNK